MLNIINVQGRITKDLELKRTQSGKGVCSFTIAVDRDFKDSNGDKTTDFLDIVAWGNTAEYVAKYLSKGQMVICSGALQTRKWTDKNGNNRTAHEIICSNIYGIRTTGATGFTEMEGDDEDGELPF